MFYDGRVLRWIVLPWMGAFLFGRTAAASSEIVCGLTQPDVISVDGLLDDWSGVPFQRVDQGAGADASMKLRCNYDSATLYLAVEVADDRLVRTRKGAPGEDRLSFSVGGARLDIWPAHPDYQAEQKVRWSAGGARDLAVASSLQPKGWSVEVAIPLGRVPGYSKGVPKVPFALELFDSDSLAQLKTEVVVSMGEGWLAFQEGSELFRWFLEENRLRPEDVTLDVVAELDGEGGPERVVAAGKIIGLLSDRYSYIALPVAHPRDVHKVRVMDLGGDGRASVIAVYTERGKIGARTVLAVFHLNPDGTINRTFAHEVGKQLGRNCIGNTVEYVPRPGKKGRKEKGIQLVIRPGRVVGFTAETFRETPAEDVRPILVPWAGPQEEIFTFDGNQVLGGATRTR